MKIYQKIMAYAMMGATALSAAGCGNGSPEDPAVLEAKAVMQRNYFDNMGLTAKLRIFEGTKFALADMDGDGDIDIVLLDYQNDEIRILENRIPQANSNMGVER